MLKSWLDEGGCFHFLRVLVLGAERGWSKKIALTVRPANGLPAIFQNPLSTFHFPPSPSRSNSQGGND